MKECIIIPVVTYDKRLVYADGLQVWFCDTHFYFIRGYKPESCIEYRALRSLSLREHSEKQIIDTKGIARVESHD